MGYLVLAKGDKTLLEELTGEGPSLEEAIDVASYLDIDVPPLCTLPQVVLINHMVGQKVEQDCYILVV